MTRVNFPGQNQKRCFERQCCNKQVFYEMFLHINKIKINLIFFHFFYPDKCPVEYLTVTWPVPDQKDKKLSVAWSNKCTANWYLHPLMLPLWSESWGLSHPGFQRKVHTKKINYVSDIASAGVGLYPVYWHHQVWPDLAHTKGLPDPCPLTQAEHDKQQSLIWTR